MNCEREVSSSSCEQGGKILLLLMPTKRIPQRRLRFAVYGALLVTIGFIILCGRSWIVDFAYDIIFVLRPNGILFHYWQKNPMPLFFEIYIFNWTNHQDLLKPNVKPRFEEIGPVVFSEVREKVDITWNPNDTVTFKQMKYWRFDQSRSAVNLSTKIVTVNIVALSIANYAKHWNPIGRRSVDMVTRLLSEKRHVETTIGELLFDGYYDPIINAVNYLPFKSRIKLPVREKVCLFCKENASAEFDGVFNVGTRGNTLGQLQRWNYKEKLPYFKDGCNSLKGSIGEFFPKNLPRDKIAMSFLQMCKVVLFDYLEDVLVDGTKAYKYVIGDSFFNNGTKVPENLCYVKGDNVRSGLFNISECKFGVPAFTSLPHFYGADPYYVESVEGLQPNKERHQVFMSMEPITGIPLHFELRFQLNYLMQPIRHMSTFDKVPKIFMPVFWVQQKGKIGDDFHLAVKVLLYMPAALTTLCGLMALFGIILFINNLYKWKSEEIHCSLLDQYKPTREEIAYELKQPLMQKIGVNSNNT